MGTQRRLLWLTLWLVIAYVTGCTVYDSSLLAGREDTARDSEHSTVAPDGGSGRSLDPVIGATNGAETESDDSTDTGAVTIDGAVVGSDTEAGARQEVHDAKDPQVESDARPTALGEEIIDDMEDGDQDIRPGAGRLGAWFTLNDGTSGASQAPAGLFIMSSIPSGRGASLFAAHTSGHGFKIWAPLFGFWLNKQPAGLKQPYDARKYTGISFWARTNATSPIAVRVVVPNTDTDPDGKICRRSGERWMFGPLREEHRGHRHLGEASDQVCRPRAGRVGAQGGELRDEDVVRGRVPVRSGERVRLLDR